MDENTEINYEVDPTADERKSFVMPAGRYALTVWGVEIGQSKAGDPKMNIKFGVNGQAGDKWLYHTITLLPKASKGHGITVHALKTLGFSVDKSTVNFRPRDLIGRVCGAELVIEEYDHTTDRGNTVKRQKNKIKEMLYPMPEDKPEMPAGMEQEQAASYANENEEVPF